MNKTDLKNCLAEFNIPHDDSATNKILQMTLLGGVVDQLEKLNYTNLEESALDELILTLRSEMGTDGDAKPDNQAGADAEAAEEESEGENPEEDAENLPEEGVSDGADPDPEPEDEAEELDMKPVKDRDEVLAALDKLKNENPQVVIKFSPNWQYDSLDQVLAESRIRVNKRNRKASSDKEIDAVSKELGISPVTPEEIRNDMMALVGKMNAYKKIKRKQASNRKAYANTRRLSVNAKVIAKMAKGIA